MQIDLGKCIAALRTEKGIPQGKFASSVGLSRGGLWRIEAGDTDPGLGRLKKIANALGMSSSELLALAEADKANDSA